jgi:hypothetical protein
MRTRKIAGLAAVAALVLTLAGVGLNAAFVDSGSATETIEVGSFGIDVSSDAPGAIVVGNTVTYQAPMIMSSAPDSAPFAFTVTSTGNIPVAVTVSVAGPAMPAPFTDLLVNPGQVVLDEGDAYVFNGGIGWTELDNLNLGQLVSITYTIDAAEV